MNEYLKASAQRSTQLANEAREGFIGICGQLDVVEGQMDYMAVMLLRILRAVCPSSRNKGAEENVNMF